MEIRRKISRKIVVKNIATIVGGGDLRESGSPAKLRSGRREVTGQIWKELNICCWGFPWREEAKEAETGNGDKNTGKQANPANTGGGTAVITSSGQSGVMKRKDLSNIPLSEQVSGSPTPDEAQKGKAVANETVTNVTIPLTATTIARYEPQSVTNTNVVANTSNTQG
ncbi:hypothetical protein K7X08_032114 [Anisodus acutangulus]|uniref:Uncharacterized protein n=1 Tax=Anisodus acutangulus TaxID=402998 RepID=A0A9Q1MT05_9SOLA|nr:hypothetical protein K7X08_032114 [Anisodus acutangulus]